MSAKKQQKKNKDAMLWILAVVVAVISIVMVFLKSNNDNHQDKGTGTAPIMTYNASVTKVGEWTEENDNGKDYYVTVLLSSDDYYCKPDKMCVMYLDDSQYKPIRDVIENIEIDFYYASEGHFDCFYTYARIHTKEMIDTKRVYFQLSGPSIYNSATLTKEDYVKTHGNADGWCEVLSGISTKLPNNEHAVKLGTSKYEGVITLFDETNSIFYVKATNSNGVKDEASYCKEFIIESLSGQSLESFCKTLSNGAKVVKVIDGVVAEDKLDERLTVIAKVIDGKVMIGYKTADDSSLDSYDGVTPSVFKYDYVRETLFVLKDEN